MFLLSKIIFPLDFSIPRSALASEDLPDPDSPTKPVVEPL